MELRSNIQRSSLEQSDESRMFIDGMAAIGNQPGRQRWMKRVSVTNGFSILGRNHCHEDTAWPHGLFPHALAYNYLTYNYLKVLYLNNNHQQVNVHTLR